MVDELQGKRISVVVPKKELVRVKKMLKDGPRTKEPKYVWVIDFRGIRSENCAQRKVKKSWKFGGSKVAFDSPERLQKMVDSYFNSCYDFAYDKLGNIRYDKDGEPIRYQARPFTVSGLSLYLGVSTRTFIKYTTGIFDDLEDDNDTLLYKEILVKARQKVEAFAEEKLYSRDGNFGAKFVLDSCFGWCTTKEQAEIEKMKFESWLKNKEFELKQQLADMGQEDTGLEIRIVRKQKDGE